MKIGEKNFLVIFFAFIWLFFGSIAYWSFTDNFEFWYGFLVFPLGANILFANLYYGWVTID